MEAAIAGTGAWIRARQRPLGLVVLSAAIVTFLTMTVLEVPLAAPPLANGRQLFFCPLWTPPVPRSVAVLHWHAAMWAAFAVLAVDLIALANHRRGRRRSAAEPTERAAAAAAPPPALRLQRVPLRVALITATASLLLIVAAAMQGYALWLIGAFGVAPWIPLVAFEAVWKYERYGAWALFGVVVLLQVGHMGEHSVQVTQLWLSGGRLAQSHGVFGQLDFETIHFVWDSAIWLSLGLLLRPFGGRNRWLWVAFAAASLHEVEHLYLFWIYQAHPAFYAQGGFEGIMGYDGVIGSPLARPYLHFAYNFVVVVPMVLALWDETQLERERWTWRAPRDPARAGALAGTASAGA